VLIGAGASRGFALGHGDDLAGFPRPDMLDVRYFTHKRQTLETEYLA